MGAFSANSGNMRQVASDVQNYQKKYVDVVSQIESEINHLGGLWNGPVYDQLKQMFNEKKAGLNEGSDLMVEFYQKLNNAADSFDSAEKSILSRFQ